MPCLLELVGALLFTHEDKARLKEENARLREENARLREENGVLRRQLAALEQHVRQLEADNAAIEEAWDETVVYHRSLLAGRCAGQAAWPRKVTLHSKRLDLTCQGGQGLVFGSRVAKGTRAAYKERDLVIRSALAITRHDVVTPALTHLGLSSPTPRPLPG